MKKLEKPVDIKRVDPIDKTKRSHHKKKFPPHWEIRVGGDITASKYIKTDCNWKYTIDETYNLIRCYRMSDEIKQSRVFLKEGNIDAALAIYAKHHPETSNWPVRFINIEPIETLREVL